MIASFSKQICFTYFWKTRKTQTMIQIKRVRFSQFTLLSITLCWMNENHQHKEKNQFLASIMVFLFLILWQYVIIILGNYVISQTIITPWLGASLLVNMFQMWSATFVTNCRRRYEINVTLICLLRSILHFYPYSKRSVEIILEW